MFFSSVHANDDLKRYPAAIQKAIEYAKNTDFSALEDGRQEIDGDKMYANLFHLTSKQKEEAHPELHKKYVDVQYWICGEELCGVAPYNGVGKSSRRARMTTCISMTT
ncbi:MAG: YhcH/YjgK/YiaL family protein [Christensenellales bacterium]